VITCAPHTRAGARVPIWIVKSCKLDAWRGGNRLALGPFTFSREQYEAALRSISA
jgi:hypothetical protein